MWSDVVARCADRALDSTDLTTVEHMGEAATLTVALRNVLRAAEVARPLATGQDRQRIDAAIQAFKQGLPQAKDARDVLEHFDDYAAGTGRIQEKDRNRGRTITFYPPWYERGASDYYLRVGPLRVSVTAAKKAAGELAAAVALVQLPTSIPPPGALRCSHVHYLGPGNRDEEHVIHDGGRHLPVGDTVPFPGIWEGQTDKTPAGGRYVVRGFEVHVEGLLVYATAHWGLFAVGRGGLLIQACAPWVLGSLAGVSDDLGVCVMFMLVRWGVMVC